MSGAVTEPDTVRLARDERAEFADFLATLTPEQWDGPTLCTRWRIRDVVAHDQLRGIEHGGSRAPLPARRAGPDRADAVGVRDNVDRSPDELVTLLREHLTRAG